MSKISSAKRRPREFRYRIGNLKVIMATTERAAKKNVKRQKGEDISDSLLGSKLFKTKKGRYVGHTHLRKLLIDKDGRMHEMVHLLTNQLHNMADIKIKGKKNEKNYLMGFEEGIFVVLLRKSDIKDLKSGLPDITFDYLRTKITIRGVSPETFVIALIHEFRSRQEIMRAIVELYQSKEMHLALETMNNSTRTDRLKGSAKLYRALTKIVDFFERKASEYNPK